MASQQQQQKGDYFPAGDDVGALVLDVGSGSTRFGYAGEDCPKQLWPSYVGARHSGQSGLSRYSRVSGQPPANEIGDIAGRDGDADLTTPFCGLENASTDLVFPLDFAQKRENLEVLPIFRHQNEQLELDCDAFETIVTRLSGPALGLNVDLEGKPILLTEPTRHYRALRTKMTEFMFERVKCEALYVAKSAVLSAFAVGRSSGCVVDVGASGTVVTPVQDGFSLQRNIQEYPVGGDVSDDHLAVLLSQRNWGITPSYAYQKVVRDLHRGVESFLPVDLSAVHTSYLEYSKRAVVRSLKESISRCADDPRDVAAAAAAAATLSSSGSVRYELPDGTLLSDVEQLGVATAELLFNPDPLLQRHSPRFLNGFQGLPKAILSCINSCDHDIRRELFGSIILTGGVTTIPGLPERTTRALQETATATTGKVKIAAPSSAVERRFSAWIGGSILASLATFQQMWLSKAEYEEHGSVLVERKCRQ